MTENMMLPEQAHAKMLEEMSKPHSMAEDHIHNWLCGQTDEELLKGIVKEGKSIKSALHALMAEAKKQKAQVISDEEGFQIIVGYFKSDVMEIAKPSGISSGNGAPAYEPKVLTPEEQAEEDKRRAESLALTQKRNEEYQAKQEQAKIDKKLADEKKKANSVGLISIFDFIEDPFTDFPKIEETHEEEEEGDDDDDGLQEGDDE